MFFSSAEVANICKALAKRNASHRKSTQVLTCEDLRSLAIGWPNATQVERKSFAKVAEFLFFFLFPRLRLGRAATFTVAAAYTCTATGSPLMVFLFLMFF